MTNEDSIKTIIATVSTVGTIEAVHQAPIDEPIKLGLQIILSLANLFYIIKQRRKHGK